MSTSASASLSLGGLEDLEKIYGNMQDQFPQEELYRKKVLIQLMTKDRYKILLYRRDEDQVLIGYALVFTINEADILWLDYIAILDEFKGMGYGSALFQALYQKYCGPFLGMMFSVEYVTGHDPALTARQKARLRFYAKQGAYQLKTDFLLPTDDGNFPMYLYFKPHKGVTSLSRAVQLQAVAQMYDYCYAHVKHRGELLQQSKSSMLDELFID